MVPIFVWLALKLYVIAVSFTNIFPLNVFLPLRVTTWPYPLSLSGLILKPLLIKFPWSAVLDVRTVLFPKSTISVSSWKFDVLPKITSEAAPTWSIPPSASFTKPLKTIVLSFWASNFVNTLVVSSEDSPNTTEHVPAALAWIFSNASVELITTLRSKIREELPLLFWIGAVTFFPLMVSVLPLLLVTFTSPVPPPSLICESSKSVSKIMESVRIILAVETLGIPLLQLPAVDQSLSPVALLNVDAATSLLTTASLPSDPNSTCPPPISIWASCSAVRPLASVPKLMTSSLKLLITILPVPQFAAELSANASEVTSSPMVIVSVPDPMVIVFALWFLFTLRFIPAVVWSSIEPFIAFSPSRVSVPVFTAIIFNPAFNQLVPLTVTLAGPWALSRNLIWFVWLVGS